MFQDEEIRIEPFEHAAGGWTSVREVGHALKEAHIVLRGTKILLKQNKPDGFACVSCSWAKPADSHPAEFCEHGAKGHGMGADHRSLHARILRAAHADRARSLVRPRPRDDRPP